MWSSSRDNWERLVAAVLRREHDWELAHAPSRSPSISTLSSASSRYWSRQNSSVSQDVSAPLPPPVPTAMASSSQVGNRKSGTVKRGGIVAGATNIFAAPRSILTALYRRRKIQHHTDHEDVAQVYGGHLRRFSLSELEIATDKFSRRNILGRGGFSMVYKGRLADGSLVGVKRLRESAHQKVWIQTEMMISSMAVDPNILCLLGFCIAPGESLLVYPVMSNGNVASRLRERPEFEPPLDWPTRMRIALGTARGLAYLHEHCGPKIIHRDVKAAQIFLDEDMEAVVGSFECAKFLDHNDADVETAVRGTIGHIAPEYLSTGRCSVKSDVFAYGIFLLELISAQKAFNLARLANDDDVMLLDWVKGFLKEKKWEIIVDADLQGNYRDEELEPLLQLAVCCTLSSPNERPSMSEIVLMLETDDFGKLEERLHPDQTSDQGLVAQEQQEEEWDEVVLQQEFNSWWEERQMEDAWREEFSRAKTGVGPEEFNRRGEEGEGMLSQQEDFKTRWKESQEKED